ncbi:hypothetical protein DHEL01_v205885 [Diaporthe helianthi]|uniref:Uncharacterized protein n=1 Tax=Diaporthe helianthi TaxID=158607 RepID=A0A2P5HZQ5_DIAHE|nr:hypothetical protein DHEL01_v205885 [Diaporthe helianthi]
MPSVLLTLTPRESSPNADTASRTSTSTTDSNRVWIILTAVAALLTLGACTALVVISFSKRRLLKQQLDETRRRNSAFDSAIAWEKPGRKRKMTAKELEMEAESTRTAMIRKSLASRSGRTASFATSGRSSMAERPESDSGEGLTYDWKEFEAGISRHSSVASLRRSADPMPELPAPTLLHALSPGRNPSLAGRAELRAPREQLHPCLRS